jgi:hypothetical protein
MGIQYGITPVDLPRGSGVMHLAPQAPAGKAASYTGPEQRQRSDSVCYSAMVKADYKKYQQMFGATMGLAEF